MLNENKDHLKQVLCKWNGFDTVELSLEGCSGHVVKPHTIAKGSPWIWRARFPDAWPYADIELLHRGYHIAYADVADLFGSPRAVSIWDRFYPVFRKEFGLACKTSVIGYSRGGLIALNWVAQNTDKVHCVYLDNPVCDIRSWPGGVWSGPGNSSAWLNCLAAYNLDKDSASTYDEGPLTKLDSLVAAEIPMLVVASDADEIVPYEENSKELEKRYKAQGGTIVTIMKPGGLHHPHSLEDPTPIVDFIQKPFLRGELLEDVKKSTGITNKDRVVPEKICR